MKNTNQKTKRNTYCAIMDGTVVVAVFTTIEAARRYKADSCGELYSCDIVIGASNIARHAADPYSREANPTAKDIKEMAV